ncbi:MAG: tRNA pseudouridine(55) synthase TruB [Bacteroidetes bacterium B1(2017)]|nr:MAG: tRNA pseudouridine(55) synthase TruB [Bacteroidetes bacterium B1(2017)]
MEDILNLEIGTVLRVYKPYTWTSFDVTKKIQRLVLRKLNRQQPLPNGQKRKVKVGHAGTLDPLATGLLIVCIGKETRNIETYMGLPKVYTGNFFLGATTPSFDKETQPDSLFSIEEITEEKILDAAKSLTGYLDQIPPVFSAIKKDGVRAYEAARAGDEIKLDARRVLVQDFKITHINLPLVGFEITCSKGTYIRSIARDFGKALNNGAYLETLCRTQIGNFTIDEAITIDELAETFAEPLKYKER